MGAANREKGSDLRTSADMKPRALAAVAVVAVAIIVRFVYLPHIMALPTFSHPVMDAAYHDNWAREIASGIFSGGEPFFRAPLYPYGLGLVYSITGGSYLVPRAIQFILGALTALLAYAIARRLLGRLAAAVAGLIVALYPVLIYFEGELLTETLFIFLIMLSLYLYTLAAERQRGWMWFLAGLMTGGALITRPTMAIFIPFALLGALLVARRRVVHALLVALGALIMLAPVTLHNAAVSGEFIPLVWQGGLNFYLGNNPGADGWSATSPELRKDWWGGYNDQIAIPEQEYGRELKYTEISDYWTRRGVRYMTSDSRGWTGLMLKKAALFWGSREFPNNLDYNFMKIHSWVLRNPLITFATIAPLAVLGLIVLVPAARRLYFLYAFFISFFAGTVAFFVCSRYRIPVLPVMAIFAGGGVAYVVDAVRSRRLLRLVAGAAVLAAAGAAVSLNLAGEDLPGLAQSYTVFANVYREEGDLDRAAAYLEMSIEANPAWGEGHEGLGLIAMERGDSEAAEDHLGRAVEVEPSRASAHRALAVLYLSRGDLERARESIGAAMTHAPYLEDSHNILGSIERQAGNTERAAELFEEEIRINPSNWRAYANLGSLRDESGQVEEAISAYERAVALRPREPDLVYALATAYARAGRDDKAREMMDRLGAAVPADPSLEYNRAVLLQNDGRVEEAVLIYERILAADPSHEGALVNLGVIYARQGRDEEAVELWERALLVNPGNANARRNIDLLRQRMLEED